MAIVGLLLVPPFLAFFYEPGAGMDMEILSFFLQVHAVSCIFMSALSLLEEVQMQTHLRPLGHAARPCP